MSEARDKFEYILRDRTYDRHAEDEEIFGELLDDLADEHQAIVTAREAELAMVCDAYGLPHSAMVLAKHLASNAELDHAVNMETVRLLTARMALEALADEWEECARAATRRGYPSPGDAITSVQEHHAHRLRAALAAPSPLPTPEETP